MSQNRIEPTLEFSDLELRLEETLQFVPPYQIDHDACSFDRPDPARHLQITTHGCSRCPFAPLWRFNPHSP